MIHELPANQAQLENEAARRADRMQWLESLEAQGLIWWNEDGELCSNIHPNQSNIPVSPDIKAVESPKTA